MIYLSLSIGGTPFPTPEGLSGLNNVGIRSILSNGTSILLFLVILISLIFLIWGGIDLILSQGEKQQVANARQKIIFSIIGLVVVLSSFMIVGIIGDAFGVNLFNLPYNGPFYPHAWKLQ